MLTIAARQGRTIGEGDIREWAPFYVNWFLGFHAKNLLIAFHMAFFFVLFFFGPPYEASDTSLWARGVRGNMRKKGVRIGTSVSMAFGEYSHICCCLDNVGERYSLGKKETYDRLLYCFLHCLSFYLKWSQWTTNIICSLRLCPCRPSLHHQWCHPAARLLNRLCLRLWKSPQAWTRWRLRVTEGPLWLPRQRE